MWVSFRVLLKMLIVSLTWMFTCNSFMSNMIDLNLGVVCSVGRFSKMWVQFLTTQLFFKLLFQASVPVDTMMHLCSWPWVWWRYFPYVLSVVLYVLGHWDWFATYVCVCHILSESFPSFSQISVFCFCMLAVGHVQLGSECAFSMYLFLLDFMFIFYFKLYYTCFIIFCVTVWNSSAVGSPLTGTYS
jgi:hypothetical protein